MILHIPLHAYDIREPLAAIGMLAFFEAVLWLAILVIGERAFPPRVAVAIGRLQREFNCVASRRLLAVGGIFLLIFVGRIALLPIFRIPPPKITDEFSQVLEADTFAHGRVTNPTHPMWFHFQTFMENQRPTYHSMYPPATGLFMALGQILTGQPWYGVLFGVAAAAAAVCWMLQGWVPPRWALWGALVFVLHAARNQLTENYVGDGVAILGGALVLGAVPRIIKRGTIASSVCLGLGLALLATSRPFEGALIAAGIGVGGICWAYRSGARTGRLCTRVALPVALILVPTFLAAGYLNWRATGSPTLAPYQLNLVEQHITRPFIWQRPASSPPRYDYPEMAAFYQQWEVNWWKSINRFPRGLVLFFINKARVTYGSLLWPLSVLLVIGSYQLLKDPSRRFLPLTFGFFLVGLHLVTYQLLPWYLGPACGLVILLAVYGVRYLAAWGRNNARGLRFVGLRGRHAHYGRRVSRVAALGIPAAYLTWIVIAFLVACAGLRHPYPESFSIARQNLLQGLQALPGKQLVIVRYSASHIPYEEWVENRADIDSAKVVWARHAAGYGDDDLLRYFKDRTVWFLEPDGENPKLTCDCTSKREAAVHQVGGFRVSCGNSGGDDFEARAAFTR